MGRLPVKIVGVFPLLPSIRFRAIKSILRGDSRRTLILASICFALGCSGTDPFAPILPDERTDPVPPGAKLVARIAHICDTQIVDEESPGRLASFAHLWSEAWRPHYAYSLQFMDGIIRAINRWHAGRANIDFVVFTGDATDNVQHNELVWFMKLFDGGVVDPRTGPDDRRPESIPPPEMDPHHPFTAQGLYRNGVHGDRPSVPWYTVLGNHDRFASGSFPILRSPLGGRYAPLPLDFRLGLFLPTGIFPDGTLAWGAITPAQPGPPPVVSLPVLVEPDADRRFIDDREFIRAHLDSVTEPKGHGFLESAPTQTWYSVSPVPGLRLIGLNSSTPIIERPRFIFSEGAIAAEQARFLRRELEKAQAQGEWVIVATHHPSATLKPIYGTSLVPETFQAMLREFPCVKLHLCGHLHFSLVIDRGGYTEMVTGAILDSPNEGRIIEIWRKNDELILRYQPLRHDVLIAPPDSAHEAMFADPFVELRREGAAIAKTFRPPA